jgi:hypothetical protein
MGRGILPRPFFVFLPPSNQRTLGVYFLLLVILNAVKNLSPMKTYRELSTAVLPINTLSKQILRASE